MNEQLRTALEDYFERFQVQPPMPFGVDDEVLAERLQQAIREGEPVPDDYDWWGDLPDDALA